jgi:hypothetical protein
MAGDAEAALGSLMWDREAAGHYPARAAGVPVARAAAQGADGSGGKLHIAASLGRLLELVGLPATRRSAVGPGPPRCCRPTRAAAGSFWGSRRAQERSGVDLPDLPGPRLWFTRGPVMSEREADAFV